MDNTHAAVSEIKRIYAELGGRVPTRDEFFALSKVTQWSVRNAFKTYAVLVTAAGFKPEREDKKKTSLEKAYEKYNAQQDIADVFQKTILPYHGKYDKKTKGMLRIVASSDWHSYWTDPFCFYVFLETCKRVKPDVIILGGDVYDFYELSRYSKDPSRILKLQDEIDYIKDKIFRAIRKACPESQIDFFVGNHEWRLFKYLCEKAPELASLRNLQLNTLLELDKYKINLVARPSMITAKTDKQMQNYKFYGNNLYVFSHGPSMGRNHASANLNKYEISGSSGHMHNFQSVSYTTPTKEVRNWTSIGCMCLLESGEEYIYEFTPWQQGFEIVHINMETRSVIKEPVHIVNGEAMVGGIYYREQKKPAKLKA